jgi:two-component system, NtrC family, sensor kinase
MQCPSCQQDNPTGQKFCGECGTPLQRPDGRALPARPYGNLQDSLSEALEQQAATAEILRVISSSLTDVQPVFDAIVRSASRLCGGEYAIVTRYDGQLLHLAAQYNPRPGTADETTRFFPQVPRREMSLTARAFVDRHVVHAPDVDAEDLAPSSREAYRRIKLRAALSVPMIHDGRPIGVVSVSRGTTGPFSSRQIALLQTFADQAVIAVENVRLFKELEARNTELRVALEQQTATAEVLKVISRSTFDLQPVLDTLIENAARLCASERGVVMRRDGEAYHGVAFYNVSPELIDFIKQNPVTPGRHSITARVALERRTIHVADLQADLEYRYVLHDAAPIRTELGVPIFRGDDIVGVIILHKLEVQPFTDKQIELVETFADQAVIAIENVRLFRELEARNRELTTALEQQTATSEILRVISSSPSDVQPVFDAIVRNAVQLCNGFFGVVTRYDGRTIGVVAKQNLSTEALEILRKAHTLPESMTRRALVSRAVVHIHDAMSATEMSAAVAKTTGYRTIISVPLLRDGQPIGTINVARRELHPFSDAEIDLLKTFADQAVIAIENVRLFTELQKRTGDLTRSVEKLTALGEVSRAVSSTLDLEAVLDIITERARQLAGADGGAIYEYDEPAQEFHLRATRNVESSLLQALRAMPLRKGEGVMGRAALTREPIQIADIATPGAYQSHLRDVLVGAGYRALLSVPLLREDQIIGSLSLNRKAPGEFPPEVIEVLKTFATQSALAIQNARLFREIEAKSHQLEVASQHKSEFLANMSHELRTPLNAIIGFSEVLTDRLFGDLNAKQEEYLRDIYASGTHLLSLINDILDLSKVEAGRMELELTDFDLPTALDSALTLIRERVGRRGITLQTSVDDRLGQIRADERKIRQVVLNLLSNAIKFTPEGGRIEVGAVPKDGFVEVSVSDTGVGIAPEDQEAVFEEFRQVGTAAKKMEGTGLGLTLCRKFVELHGGRIWVKSQVGVGSTFRFTIPV